MQAVVLVGGEGTRLRPLTSVTPKPVVPLVDRPFMAYMLEWLRGHGIEDVVLACGFAPDKVRAVLGDGSRWGVRLTYFEEPEPRGTAGALKFVEEALGERFLMLNGDTLTDFDLGAQLEQHERTGAVGTLGLVPVEDPSSFGLVRLREDRSVAGFLEKPEPEEIDTDLVSAGIYVLERAVLDLIPAGRNVSIEREVWPRLVGNGLFGHPSPAYWLDIGTPERYLQGTFDILRGTVATGVRPQDGVLVEDGGRPDGAGELVHLGRGVRLGTGATVERSSVHAGVHVGDGARLRDCIVAAGARIGARARLSGCVVGEGATIPDDAVLDGEKVS